MATSPRIAMRAVRNLYGEIIPKEEVPEAASCTFKQGALVVSTSGYVNECGADPVLILGVATKDGQNGTAAGDKTQPIEVAMPGILFLGNLSNVADDAVGAATDRWGKYGVLKHSASGKWMVDKDETTNDRVTIWNFFLQDKDVLTNTRVRVYFAFDPVYAQATAVD